MIFKRASLAIIIGGKYSFSTIFLWEAMTWNSKFEFDFQFSIILRRSLLLTRGPTTIPKIVPKFQIFFAAKSLLCISEGEFPSGSQWFSCNSDLCMDAILDQALHFWFHQKHNLRAPIAVCFTVQMISGNSNSSCLSAALMKKALLRKTQLKTLIFAWLLSAAHPNLSNVLRNQQQLRTCQWTWSQLGILTKPKKKQFPSVLLLFCNFPQSK